MQRAEGVTRTKRFLGQLARTSVSLSRLGAKTGARLRCPRHRDRMLDTIPKITRALGLGAPGPGLSAAVGLLALPSACWQDC
jgi:hypothetical protein